MYTIELTRGAGWNAPVIETHFVKHTIHIVDVERSVRAFLAEAQRKPNRLNPDSYRIVNPLGRHVKTGTK